MILPLSPVRSEDPGTSQFQKLIEIEEEGKLGCIGTLWSTVGGDTPVLGLKASGWISSRRVTVPGQSIYPGMPH
jgi:hypothetical protein